MAIRTIGTLLAEARTLLQDKVQAYRYSDDELLENFNGAVGEARIKRPDLFLGRGLRAPLPFHTTADLAAPFPYDIIIYQAALYYVVGRAELREDSFSNDSRAVSMMNKFVAQLTAVQS
jgi:hypothetical protein